MQFNRQCKAVINVHITHSVYAEQRQQLARSTYVCVLGDARTHAHAYTVGDGLLRERTSAQE